MALINESLLTDIKHKSDFVQKTGTGDLDTISGLDNIKDAIMRRIFTTPGSLVHRPTYGAGLKSYVGSPMTINTQQKLALTIQDQVLQEPRISKVNSIQFVNTDQEPEKVFLVVKVEVIGYGEVVAESVPFGEVF